MKRHIALACFLCLISLPLAAQSYPQVEAFGGYAYARRIVPGSDINENGWNASVTGNVNKTLGISADVSGLYETKYGVSVNAYTYTFGPVISLNHEGKINPFVHALFGRSHFSTSGLAVGSGNAFTVLMGGGADLKINQRFAYRLVQADWLFDHFSGSNSSKNVRISTGIVLRF